MRYCRGVISIATLVSIATFPFPQLWVTKEGQGDDIRLRYDSFF